MRGSVKAKRTNVLASVRPDLATFCLAIFKGLYCGIRHNLKSMQAKFCHFAKVLKAFGNFKGVFGTIRTQI